MSHRAERPLSPPAGFRIGHWTDEAGRTGCTAVIAPEGTRGGVDVRGGGPGTRETEVIGPLAGTDRVSAVMLAGGSAYGLAAADGAMRWLEEHGIGYPTPAGIVPIVPAAIVYDLAEGDPRARPGAESGYAACEAASEGVPACGRIGAGTGTLVVVEPSTPGEGQDRVRDGEPVESLPAPGTCVLVIDDDASILSGASEGAVRVGDVISAMDEVPDLSQVSERNTTLVCVMTDAPLDKAGCARVARAASAGVARAVEPVFTDVDGDVVFCLASGENPPAERFLALQVATLAARVSAEAIRDAVRSARHD